MLGRMTVLACALAMATGEALACSILPPLAPPGVAMIPGEGQADYEARAKLHFDGFAALQEKKARDQELGAQRALWANSKAVAVAEVVSIERERPIGPPGQSYGRGNQVRVKVTSWLKGTGRAANMLTLAHVDYTSCGAVPFWRVLYGEPGQRFVLFFETGKMAQADMREGMEVSRVVAPEIVAAMAARAR